MSWVLYDPCDKAIIKEVGAQSDRGAIIVATALLEGRLERTIKLRLTPDIDAELNGRVFGGTGPLSSFSAKIDLGMLLQIYPEQIRIHLHKIRDLRNCAAHETDTICFDTQTIKDRCENLSGLLGQTIWSGMEHNMRLMRATGVIPDFTANVQADSGEEDGQYSLRINPKATRDKFLACIKAALFHLHAAGQIFEKIRLELPASPDKLGVPPIRRIPRSHSKRRESKKQGRGKIA